MSEKDIRLEKIVFEARKVCKGNDNKELSELKKALIELDMLEI